MHIADWIANNEGHAVTRDKFNERFDAGIWSDLDLDQDQLPELIADLHEAAEHAEFLLHAIKS
ncbi:MAG: hypothetical protein QF570_00780 [Myxococcota bacterium]|nr:hypothetical protein [Myxococcota bacterium]